MQPPPWAEVIALLDSKVCLLIDWQQANVCAALLLLRLDAVLCIGNILWEESQQNCSIRANSDASCWQCCIHGSG